MGTPTLKNPTANNGLPNAVAAGALRGEAFGRKPPLPLAVLAGWIAATGFCGWFEGARLWQLSQSPAGVLAWFSTWNLDSSLPLVVLASLPVLLLLLRRTPQITHPAANSQGALPMGAHEGGAPKKGASAVAPESGAPKMGARYAAAANPKSIAITPTIALALLNLAVNASIGLRSVEIPATTFDSNLPRTAAFHSLPPAYHDEFSYLLQARTFLAGRICWPAMTVGGDAFHQIHVLNRPVTASRYFPWTGLWIAPFLAAGMPIAGHWLASSLAVAIFHRLLLRLTSRAAAFAGGLILAICPGMAVFSNLLLAHQPALLALATFLLCFHNLQLTNRPRWAWLAGIALTCAMLGRPMTAAGFAAPCGIALTASLFRSLQVPAARKVALHTIAGFAIPLAAGFVVLGLCNSQISGNWNKSAYQFYTDTWTPRHRFGFNNALTPPSPENVLAKYDAWAENLTPRLALRNLRHRLLASSQWTLGIAALLALLPAACMSLFHRSATTPPGQSLLRLTACSVASLHLVHIPYWYDGILHWHYVFETAPLLLLLSAVALEHWFAVLQPLLGRRAARNWLIALLASALLPNWLDTEFLWGPSRVSLAVSEQAFSRVRLEAFERVKQKLSRQRPCLILVDEQNSDQQLSYIINPPDFAATVPALVARLPGNPEVLAELRSRFPDRSLWKFNPQTFSVQQLQVR